MIGKTVRWTMNNYFHLAEPDYRSGTVVAEDGNWLVIRAHVYPAVGANPFLIKRYDDVELAQ